ncbi:amidase [Achromobacter sp. SD115]|uniref:amidase n=1 Tax=Achromobacter sp. SD115 TaxID=2782011 RepID=UPI001A96CFC3|nr:amidase [Achromobacter sp. SD115]MBO1012519.1 amidase [Achromobacter sp. SD115]
MLDPRAHLSIGDMRRRYGQATAGERVELVSAQAATFERSAAELHCATRIYQPCPPAGRSGGLLEGVALAHKDAFETGAHAPGRGRPLRDDAPGPMATVLRRLQDQGALNLGALAMAEHACGATAENPHGPALVNPLDPAAAVGGSSSGCAVAVAAGLVPASLGTDTAGSVRMPAATCGLVGLKPTQGVIPADGVAALAPTLDTVGVIGRDALDAACVYAALLPSATVAPALPTDAAGIEQELSRPRRWRVASTLATAGARADVGAAMACFEQRLRDSARIGAQPGPDLDRLNRLAQIVLHAEAAATLAGSVRRELASLAPATQAIALPGWAMPAIWYRHALSQIASLRAAFVATYLADADLLLTPCLAQGVPDRAAVTTSSPAFDPRALAALHRHHAYLNYLGLPALVLPVGIDALGRPVCVQAVGAPGSEALLLAFAHQFALPFSAILQH